MGFKLSGLKLPGFNKKKEVTDSSTTFEEKNVLMQEKMNRIYKFGGIAGIAVGVLSLLALNGALPLKSTVVEAYLINGVTGVAERLTSVKKENLSENEALAKYFITQYVKRREGYNYFSLQHDYDYVHPENDLERWRTNLFVRTTKRNYSMELNARTFRQPDKIAFVVNYQYPQERRKEQAEIEKKRIEALNKRQEEQAINRSLENAKSPKNWDYWKRVADGSQSISPDYAYDDGRYTWFGFSPLKKIPSVFVMSGEQETLTNPVVKNSGSFTVVGVPVDQRFVLRMGNQVVGVENRGFGKVRLPAGDTVSPNVEKEVIQ
ncbi:TPA: TrbG/VirB9 family P-type conjugative transfer protein [Klebsiella pneumoniae]|nr:TrbG/VirB9 family P-type conjugative transfer protein [Klebsiella pneumoniae]